MANLTKKQREGQEKIKAKIREAHARGKCDKDGNPIEKRVYGVGHLNWAPVTWGEQRLNIWPRDADGNLIDD